jgi:phosphatidylglycerophosphate synthase
MASMVGSPSELGARLDMESDALLVLSASLALFVHGRLGAFILVPGLLRYGYVLALAMFAALRRDAPRSKLGRYIFSLMMVSLIASLWPLPYHAPCRPPLPGTSARARSEPRSACTRAR